MKAMLSAHPLDKARQFIDIATEFVELFLDKYDKQLDEKDLDKLEHVANHHRACYENFIRAHENYKAQLQEKTGGEEQ